MEKCTTEILEELSIGGINICRQAQDEGLGLAIRLW